MKLGPRVAIVTTLLMAAALACAIWAVLAVLRADQVRKLDGEAHAMADALAAGIEPLTPDEAGTLLPARVASANARLDQFRLETIAWGAQRPNNFWAGLVDQASRLDAPVGQLFEPAGMPLFYAMAIPLHNAQPGAPDRQTSAFLGLVCDSSFITAEVMGTGWRLLPFLILGILAFGILLYLTLRRRVVNPLRRLIEAIDAVAQGDMTRAVLPGRDDEIGSLAGQFNKMMDSLREAREKEARATAARQAMETHLRRAEKLATVGQVAAEIAHEVGTPLNVIGGRARSLARRPEDLAEVQKHATIITDQVERITKIIRQVLDASRKNRPCVTQVDVAQVVREALSFVEELVRRQHIEVRVRAAPELQPIPGDPDEIQQVCLNIVMNAIHAMKDGGSLTIDLEQVVRRKEGLALSPPSTYLMLQVSDTGPGIPVADRDKIFEPFFTTKDPGQGSGLGLAVSKGIVKDHEGWIEVDDAHRGGAVLRVFLPVGSAAERPRTDGDTPAPVVETAPQPVR
jgi:signal transduction histidine kinase